MLEKLGTINNWDNSQTEVLDFDEYFFINEGFEQEQLGDHDENNFINKEPY